MRKALILSFREPPLIVAIIYLINNLANHFYLALKGKIEFCHCFVVTLVSNLSSIMLTPEKFYAKLECSLLP